MLRRTIGITATAAAISIAVILPAGAQTATPPDDTYGAGAKATALDLSVFGNGFAVSETAAGVLSTPKAVADGHALLTPLGGTPGAPVESTGDEETGADCTTIALPSPINAASLLPVCVTTKASVTGTNPNSSSTSSEVVIEISSPDLIAGTDLVQAIEGVQTATDALFAGLTDVFTPLTEGTGVDIPGVVDSLLSEIHDGELLVRITVAPTSSTSQGTKGVSVSASATSNGVIVELLPNLTGGALAVVTVGPSTASVLRPLAGGAPTLDGAASLVTITYPNGQLAGLSALTDPITEVLNTAFDQLACGDANPLSPVICFTKGVSAPLTEERAKVLGLDFGTGMVGQETSVLSLTLLAAAGNGGIELNVGHTAAAAGSQPPLPALARQDCVDGDADCPLPRTGGEAALPLTMALLGMGAAGAAVLRRSRQTV